jgi:hypothetical protein
MTWLTKKIAGLSIAGLSIADCGFIESENHAVIAAPLAQDSSLTINLQSAICNLQSAIRNPQFPEIRVSLRPSGGWYSG